MKNIIIDTNIIVRLFVKDIELQLQKAIELVGQIENGEKRGLLSILVINEAIWILEKYYNLKRELYIPQLLKLLALKNIKVLEVKKQVIVRVLENMPKHKFDFTDSYLFLISENKEIASFDKDFLKLAKN